MLLIQNSTTERGVVQHYRAGLAIDNSSENARDAYRQARHLAAGLLPRQRHVCFGDYQELNNIVTTERALPVARRP